MSTATEITFKCGHVEIVGGNVADPTGILCDSREYEQSEEYCTTCRQAVFRAAHLYWHMERDERLDTHAHLPFLREHARGNVLEIGVHCGISTTALLAGLEENGGHLWSVDVHPSCRYVWYGHPQWTFICPWSGDKLDESIRFDMAFIDGDHAYEEVAQDLEACRICVKPGGLILCHDADCPSSFPGVRQAIEESCKAWGFKHELRPGSHGLEVIYIPNVVANKRISAEDSWV